VVRLIGSPQLTATNKVVTPVNWRHGEDASIVGAAIDDVAKKQDPKDWKAPKPYILFVPQPL
jgi:alkyl hydroperoxide reductase subunit AhpC